MLSAGTVETALAIGVVLCFLGFDVVAWWMLWSGEIQRYRRAYREWMMRKLCPELVEGWLEEIAGENGDGVGTVNR